jgi:hypothetical protein
MANPAIAQIERFQRNMQKIAIGAAVARRNRPWIITEAHRCDTSASLALRSGRRTIRLIVPICLTGPCLFDLGLRSVTHAPAQRALS